MSLVECNWTGSLTSPVDLVMANPVRPDYTWTSASWNPTTGVFTKDVSILRSVL
jgi:hypothetical protein